MSRSKFRDTSGIPVPKNIAGQIIGQDEAVDIIKKAAKQRRHVLLIGTPGTGKSLLGQALAELLPKSTVVDILSFPNPSDESSPKIRIFPAGKGRRLIEKTKLRTRTSSKNQQTFFFILALVAIIVPWYMRNIYGDIMAAASLIAGMMFVVSLSLIIGMGLKKQNVAGPKLLVDNGRLEKAPFVDATGAHAGALLGDVLHDPFQSGGLGTPAHLRVQPGMIHRANNGVLFVDEVGTLAPKTQQDLLTAMQEGKYQITGQSERSAGAMVRTDAAPCKFVLVAAGNVELIQKMNPALRSRIRGYGYEIYMNDTMPDTPENQSKIAQFVAQEVVKDEKIPHFTRAAVEEIIKEAKKRSGRKGHLTLILRELGGLVRAAGDLAFEEKSNLVRPSHVLKAKKLARTLEHQIADDYIEKKKEYNVIRNTGAEIGRVNGLAVLGGHGSFSGLVLPIEAAVTLGEKTEFVATGKLGRTAKEAVENVSAVIKKVFNEDIRKTKDIHVQFLQTMDSGVEGDSASISVAACIISALKDAPVRQDLAMTGSLSIRGEVLPVGGVTQKIEAAIEAGLKEVIIPKANLRDVVLSEKNRRKIKITSVGTIRDVIEIALHGRNKKRMVEKFKKFSM